MDESASAAQSAEQSLEHWVCRNCGAFNSNGLSHCDSCGFVKGYDPDTAPVQASPMPALFIPREDVPGRVVFYLSLIQTLAVLAIAALLIPLLLRMQANWPFQSPYERDAMQLAARLMAMSASLELGMTKAEYDAQLAPLLGENARFRGMYGERPERQRDSYQKLVQAAEFYGLAGQAWTSKLNEDRLPPSVMATSPSGLAERNVQEYWQRAKSSATGALSDLR